MLETEQSYGVNDSSDEGEHGTTEPHPSGNLRNHEALRSLMKGRKTRGAIANGVAANESGRSGACAVAMGAG
jgi:hypothetical protein